MSTTGKHITRLRRMLHWREELIAKGESSPHTGGEITTLTAALALMEAYRDNNRARMLLKRLWNAPTLAEGWREVREEVEEVLQ